MEKEMGECDNKNSKSHKKGWKEWIREDKKKAHHVSSEQRAKGKGLAGNSQGIGDAHNVVLHVHISY